MMNIEKLIRSGNVITTEYKEAAETGRYLGNGRFGGVMSGLGLNMSPRMQAKYPGTGQSQFTHLNHWGRFQFISDAAGKETVADYMLPLFKMHWEKEPELVVDYNQCQDFYDGVLTTSYALENGTRVKVTNWFDMVNKNLSGVQFEVSEGIIPVKVSAVTDFIPYAFLYKTRTAQQVSVKQAGDNWCITIECKETINHRSSSVYFKSTVPVESCEDGLRFMVAKGKNEIFISYGEPVVTEDAERSLERTKEFWHRNWEQGGWLDFPEETAQKTWIRSVAYIVASYEDDLGPIQPACGLTGNMFPFHFVQDMEYISPAMMMMGHADIAKRWIEKFAEEIEEMKQYAKSLWPDAEGIYPPWELPFGSITGYHSPSVPVVYCYEPHNNGYMCRLAKEAADFVSDRNWAEKYAYPIIKEVSRFYQAFSTKKEDGKWHLEWYPCIGQDEAGGRNKKDYLCTMYSAKYSFQTAVECGLDTDGSIAAILRDGLAFESLISKRGTYHTAYGADDFGKQKHPVQLDGVAYFPIEKEPLTPESIAYSVRHEITERAKEPFFHGWTLGEFLLAGSNIKDVEGWREDWASMRPSHYTDSEWVQIYETSGQAEKSFYVTTHGMVLQSLIRNYVNDYWGNLDIGACPVFHGKVSFGNIRTRLGVTVSGIMEEGRITVELEAVREGTFTVNGKRVTMKQGEKKEMNL